MSSPLTVVRTRHDKSFVIIPNAIAQNKRLTLAARGLLTHLLSLPDGYRVSVKSLADQLIEGQAAINRMKNELMAHGYVTQRRLNVNGRWQWEMAVYDTPRADVATPEDIVETPTPEAAEASAPEVVETPEPVTVKAPAPSPEPAPQQVEAMTQKPSRGKGRILERTERKTGGGRDRAPASPLSTPEPSPRCARHVDGDPGTPCRACGTARERYQQWVDDESRRRHEADRAWTQEWLAEYRAKQSPRESRSDLAAAEFEVGRRQSRSKYRKAPQNRFSRSYTVQATN